MIKSLDRPVLLASQSVQFGSPVGQVLLLQLSLWSDPITLGVFNPWCQNLTKMANLSEKFCLKWNDFQKNIVGSYHDLRKETDFCDVTLVCEEDKHIEAHRIILTACSPVFSSILKRNKHSHPLIYMRGVKAKDLVAIVDFIYYGEANMYEDELGGFLALAEELQLKGLANLDKYQDQFKKPKQSASQLKPIHGQGEYPYKHRTSRERDTKIVNTFEDQVFAGKLVFDPLNTNKEDFKAHLDSMMAITEYGENKYTCRVKPT